MTRAEWIDFAIAVLGGLCAGFGINAGGWLSLDRPRLGVFMAVAGIIAWIGTAAILMDRIITPWTP